MSFNDEIMKPSLNNVLINALSSIQQTFFDWRSGKNFHIMNIHSFGFYSLYKKKFFFRKDIIKIIKNINNLIKTTLKTIYNFFFLI